MKSGISMLHYGYNMNLNRSTPVVETMPIRLAGVAKESIVDGPELRFVIFVQGCPHKCKGCHNPETHSAEGGFMTTTSIIWREIMANPLLKGITFSGGEPFLWGRELATIGRAAADRGLNILTYTGYTYDKLLKMAETDRGVYELLSVSNYLIDGPFMEEQRSLSLQFRGSTNQRILDVTCYPNNEAATILKTL